MDLSALLARLKRSSAYQEALDELRNGGALSGILGLPRAVRPAIAAALAEDLAVPVVLLVARHDRMLTLIEELPAWSPRVRILPFPDPSPLFYERVPWSPRTIQDRLRTLIALTHSRQPGSGPESEVHPPTLIVAPARATITRTIPPRELIAHSRWIRSGGSIRLDRLLSLLMDTGYEPYNLVTAEGQFSHRGGILDVWPCADSSPVRIEFFGEEIETLRRFDPATQRSTELIEGVRIAPAREALPRFYQEAWDEMLPDEPPPLPTLRTALLEFFLPWMYETGAGLLEFLPPRSLILHDDRPAFDATVEELEEHALALKKEQSEEGWLPSDAPVPYLTPVEIADAASGHILLDMSLTSGEPSEGPALSDRFAPGPRLGGHLQAVLDHLGICLREHDSVVVVSRQAPRLSELWSETGIQADVVEALPEPLPASEVHFIHGALSEGWTADLEAGPRIHLLTDAEIFGWSKPRPRVRPIPRAAAPENLFADLRPGDMIVHVTHGIGLFKGLVDRVLDGISREFLLVEYADGDQLFVPIHQADHITRYVGVEGTPPILSRLGTQEWERTKTRVRQAVAEVARDLVELYARRATVSGHAFSADTPWQKELEASFPYVETDDQLRAIEAAKKDMEHDRPMDRLICGDVGYGKTEVALRSAFKAVMDGKQVALLVPTTVLAQQHFNTFRQRLGPFPVEVEMLSRFRTPAEIDRILGRIGSGEVDIVIGTHRLLQRDVNFKDLGLLVIDEEQRFGVTHKEYLKKLRTEVDVLTMTATPIPRTLYLALAGARDISNINTPPEERLPVTTHVGPYEPRLVRQAILRELDRGGQVFFVHNRVQTIEGMHRRLTTLIPEARIAVAHGQMPERDLEAVMEKFTTGEVDVLLSTSIIESGLDIPNANTLIVDRAETFGLAQLYQLRGRVGRGASRAYAYLFRDHRFRPTEEALQRLEIIAEHSQLGAGYSIAMRDLEMRGAGDVLGTRQHGFVAAVGFHLYTRLLGAEIRRLKAGKLGPTSDLSALPAGLEAPSISVDLPLPASIPADYVANRDLRLQLYRRMAELRSEEEIEKLNLELVDRFGPPPEAVTNLLTQLRIKLLAMRAGVESVSVEDGKILIRYPEEGLPADLPDLGKDTRWSKRGLWMGRAPRQEWQPRLLSLMRRLAATVAPTGVGLPEPSSAP